VPLAPLRNPLDNPPLFPHIPRPMLSLFIIFLLTIHIIVSLLIVLLVLMQRPKSEGLGAAFGGGMTENLFGAQTSNVLANATRWLGGIFFLLTLILSILYAKQSTQRSAIQAALLRSAAAQATLPAPAALSGTATALSGSSTGLSLPAASPANTLLPAPTLNSTPVPAATPVSSGTYSGH
jgi:preprotein translocase subunit SecG